VSILDVLLFGVLRTALWWHVPRRSLPNIFSAGLCWIQPSPDTSRVIETLPLVRPILSTSCQCREIPLSRFGRAKSAAAAVVSNRFSTSSPT